MATWVNILDVLYPIGALYLSRSSTSPASIIGGTWTQIKGALLAAYGANGFANNTYGGNTVISINQMPAHRHTLDGPPRAFSNNSDGGAIIAERFSTAAMVDWGAEMGLTGGGAVFLPYHYGVYIWFRAA